ncbi:MAG: hypothetical protein IJS88_02560 [Alphaproteobacteria bacterium]|nr:hypothetical protein [Alphaproteobacteria bacterium]
MITEKNEIMINYIGEKTEDLYVSEIKCKEDENDNNFIELQKICLRLAKYKRYKDDVDRELQSIKQRKIAGVFLLLRQLKQNNIAFAAVRQVLQFPFISYCLNISKINPVEYNFTGQLREYRKNALLEGIYTATKDEELDFLKTCRQIKCIDVWYEDSDFNKILVYIFMAKSVKFIDFATLFFCNNEMKIDMSKLSADFIASGKDDALSLCHMLQERIIAAENGDMDIFKDIPDSLKYIFEPTDGKYLYLEQLLDLYAHIFGCSLQSAYKMAINYNHCDKDNGKSLWQEYEQQITDPEYYTVSKKLKAMQHQNLRSSLTYTLFYAILLHMRLMRIKKLAKAKNIKI